jgi:hypothetical protein
MGWSYRKRLRFGPMRINLSRSGIGTSWGVPGFRITRSSTGRRYLTLSLPGTGLSWRKTLGRLGRSTRPRHVAVLIPPAPTPITQPSPGPPSPPAPGGALGPPLVNGMPWWKQAGIKGP